MTWFSASAAPGDLRPVLHKPVPRPPRPQRLLREIPGRDEEEEGAGLGPEGVRWGATGQAVLPHGAGHWPEKAKPARGVQADRGDLG